MSCEIRFEKELHRRGLRVTPQREAILGALHSFQNPFTAEAVFQRAVSKSPGLKISTVYRTLELLRSIHLVSVVEVADRGRHYVHVEAETPHFHLVCQECGRTVGVDFEEIGDFERRIEKTYRFQIDVGRVSLSGLCEECERMRR